jgi:hypothetical protein
VDNVVHSRAVSAALSVSATAPLGQNDYVISGQFGSSLVGHSRDGIPSVLFPLASVPTGVARRGGGFALIPADRVSYEYAGNRWEQASAVLECSETNLLNTFVVLAADIIDRAARSEKEFTWQRLVGWVEEWQSLLGKKLLLTAEQQLGLWGELWVIAHAAQPDLLVAAWRGPEDEPIDFYLGDTGIEVKTSRRAHVHFVSQKQVDSPVGESESYFLSIWALPDPSSGSSLCELVEDLTTRIADPPTFLRTLGSKGYSPVDRDQYQTKFSPLEVPIWFPVEGVPRVRLADEGVSNIRFVVTLDTEKSLDDARAKLLWQRACGDVPLRKSTY